jgi:hypothetical protein
MILERNIDDEHIMNRRLVMSVSASELASPSGQKEILNLIRNWVETIEGDGSIMECRNLGSSSTGAAE